MTISVKPGYGSLLKYSETNSGFAELGEIVDGWDTTATKHKVDTTLLADDWEKSVPVDGDPGTLTFECALANDGDVALRTAMNAGTVYYWQLWYGTTGRFSVFQGWVQSVGSTVKKREKLVTKFVIQVTGTPDVVGTLD